MATNGMKKNYQYNIISGLIFIFLLIVWQLFSLLPRFNFLFGSPIKIISFLFSNLFQGTLLIDFLVTGFEALIGFIIGVILGIIGGFLLWYSPLIARISRPYVIILGAIPIFAFAPIIIIWFGIGIGMKIALATFGTFLVALVQAYEGAKNVEFEELRLLKLFGASRSQVLQKVVFPSSMSWVLASLKLNVGFALLGAFIGEFISSNTGLGHFMLRAGSLYDIPSVFAGGILLIILALLFNVFVNVVEKNRRGIIKFFSVQKNIRDL